MTHAQLMEASRKGDLESMQQALASNADLINETEKKTGLTALHAAAQAKQPEAIAFLLTKVDMNACEWRMNA